MLGGVGNLDSWPVPSLAQMDVVTAVLAASVGLAIVAIAMLLIYLDRRDKLDRRGQTREKIGRVVPQPSQIEVDQQAEREQKAYAQHVALNDLAAEKMKLEIQYLQLQTKIGELEVSSRERADEYHRLMSEKARFEIQSLKLHIREQNKRLDDYTGFNDDE